MSAKARRVIDCSLHHSPHVVCQHSRGPPLCQYCATSVAELFLFTMAISPSKSEPGQRYTSNGSAAGRFLKTPGLEANTLGTSKCLSISVKLSTVATTVCWIVANVLGPGAKLFETSPFSFPATARLPKECLNVFSSDPSPISQIVDIAAPFPNHHLAPVTLAECGLAAFYNSCLFPNIQKGSPRTFCRTSAGLER